MAERLPTAAGALRLGVKVVVDVADALEPVIGVSWEATVMTMVSAWALGSSGRILVK